jgi:hypothetical protein
MEPRTDRLPEVGRMHNHDVCERDAAKHQPIGGQKQADRRRWDDGGDAL